MKYFHQYSDSGNHRLGTSTIKSNKIKWGKWASYETPAMLGQYAAVTDYYSGSVAFPDCKLLYKIRKDVWPLVEVEERGE